MRHNISDDVPAAAKASLYHNIASEKIRATRGYHDESTERKTEPIVLIRLGALS